MEDEVKRVQDRSLQRLILGCKGGLGNQLFEYAAGLYFAQRASVPLEIVRTHVKKGAKFVYHRPFQLDAFSTDANVRVANLIDRFRLSPKPRLRFLGNELVGITSTQTIEEQGLFQFAPDILDGVKARTVYLVGHWQAAGYAEAVEGQLRKSLRLRNIPQQRNLDYADAIRALACPVSIHIRAGDYAGITTAATSGSARVTWMLQPTYYRGAVAQIRNLLPEASFVVFSDDQRMAREIMAGEPVSLWIEGNGTHHAHEELCLMSYCRHHIIANSTFSWWGAWLNPEPDKTVIAPKYWFNTSHSFFPDLYPPGWLLLDNRA